MMYDPTYEIDSHSTQQRMDERSRKIAGLPIWCELDTAARSQCWAHNPIVRRYTQCISMQHPPMERMNNTRLIWLARTCRKHSDGLAFIVGYSNRPDDWRGYADAIAELRRMEGRCNRELKRRGVLDMVRELPI